MPPIPYFTLTVRAEPTLLNPEPSPLNLVAVTTPVKYPSPTIKSFDDGFVVPIPVFPLT